MEISSTTRGLTILIATYNAAVIIGETLRRLFEMDKVPNMDWEILIVDNNSSDDTVEITRNYWVEPGRLRIINEPKQGTAFAVNRGILEAKFDYVGIIDQDNWVQPDWMQKAIVYIEAAPRAAMVCARGYPIFESEPPAWFSRYQISFAVGQQSQQNGAIIESNRFFYNAGSILRKKAYVELFDLGFTPMLQSRSGKQLLSGDDTELQILFQLMRWEIHYQDDLCFDHFMPTARMNLDYLKALRKGFGASSVYLELYRDYLRSHFGKFEMPTYTWLSRLRKSFVNLFRDPLALVASCFLRFASNDRVVKFWTRWGEFKERVRINSDLDRTRKQLYTWLDLITGKAEQTLHKSEE